MDRNRLSIALLGLVLAAQVSAVPAVAQSPFIEDTTSILRGGAPRGWLGAYWGDADRDGDLDLMATDADRSDVLFVNGGGGLFESIPLTLSPYREVNGGGWSDVDRDGDLDFIAASIAGSALVLSSGSGLPPYEWVPLAFDGDRARDIVAADYDRDGDPDIALVAWNGGLNLLYRNAGFGYSVGQALNSGTDGTTACWSDFDGDGWVDLFGVNASGDASVLYRNVEGVLTEVVGSAPSAEGGHAQGCGWGDFDGDGDFDLFVARGGLVGQSNRLYRNDGGILVSIPDSPVSTEVAGTFGSAWGDVDNDGDLDLVTVNRDAPDALYVNDGGTFERIEFGAASDGWSLAATLVDDDGDGDLDLFTTHGSYATPSSNRLYRNTTDSISADRHWLALDLRGVDSDRFGLGARARVFATIGGVHRELVREVVGRSGRMAQDGFRLHFGLGDATVVDSVVIDWPVRGQFVYRHVPVDVVRVYGEGDIALAGEPRPSEQEAALYVTPNPTLGDFEVVATSTPPGPLVVDLFDVLGRRVAELRGTSTGQPATLMWSAASDLPAGRYVVRLRGGRASATFTIR
jgi:hypothetical protein